MVLEIFVDLFVAVDKTQEQVWPWTPAMTATGHGDKPFKVNGVGTDEEVDDLLLYDGPATDVGQDDKPRPFVMNRRRQGYTTDQTSDECGQSKRWLR